MEKNVSLSSNFYTAEIVLLICNSRLKVIRIPKGVNSTSIISETFLIPVKNGFSYFHEESIVTLTFNRK